MNVVDRFMQRVVKDAASGCWLWTGSRLPGGYGTFWFNGGPKRAHRVSYELFVGAIPDGAAVLHKCDNPPCVNPDHLFSGTQADNMTDCCAKGRMNVNQSRNERPSTKLTDEQIEEIIARRLHGDTGRAIAAHFGVDPSTISLILRQRGIRKFTKRRKEPFNVN